MDIPCFLLTLHVYFSAIKTFHYYYYFSYRDSGPSKNRVKKSLFCQSRTLLLSRSIYDFIIRLSAAATSTECSVSVCRARRCRIYRSFERCNDFIIDRPHRVPRDVEERKDRVVPRGKNTRACILSGDWPKRVIAWDWYARARATYLSWFTPDFSRTHRWPRFSQVRYGCHYVSRKQSRK